MNEALLALLSALVGGLIWLVKAMNARSDRLIEQRDKEVAKLISTLEKAVETFAEFRRQEDEVHNDIVADLKAGSQIQMLILEELRSMRSSG